MTASERFTLKDGVVMDNGKPRYFKCDHGNGDFQYFDLADLWHEWFMQWSEEMSFVELIESELLLDIFSEITEEEYRKGVAENE